MQRKGSVTGPVEEQAGQSSKELAESFPKRQRDWLPIVAPSAVLLVLLVLAATPALMLHRMSRTTERMTTLLLPAYEAVRDFAYVTERRLAAARSVALSDDPRYHLELAEGRAAEDSALRVMEQHAGQLGVRFSAHVNTLRQLVARRDSIERAIGTESGPGNVVPLARFDALNAEALRQEQHLRGALSDVTDVTLDDNARWAAGQRQVAVLLAIIAAAAALLLGWFGLQQQRPRHTAQHARALAERRREELERMTESRERLMRGFTHDMKNPLGAASGYLQLLADGIMGRMTAEQKRSVDRASGSIMSALDLVDELLELARAESGHLAIRRRRTDLRTLVRDVAEEYRGQAEAGRPRRRRRREESGRDLDRGHGAGNFLGRCSRASSTSSCASSRTTAKAQASVSRSHGASRMRWVVRSRCTAPKGRVVCSHCGCR